MSKIRLLLVDDHQIMREGLRLVLAREPDFEILGEAADGAAALTLIESLRPDVAILDVEMRGMSGVEVAERVGAELPKTKILVLSAHADAAVVRGALRAGVAGFLVKTGDTAELIRAIRTVAGGAAFFCPHVATLIAHEYRRAESVTPGAATPLSEREMEIIRSIADGHSTKEIAFALGLSTKTVETHRAHVMAKLGIFSVAGLTKYALRAGLTSA